MHRTLVALAALALLAPVNAHAQIGGIIRRGAEKAANARTTERPAPTFDGEILELTTPRVDQVVRGLKAWNDAQARADVSGARKAYEASNARLIDFSNRYSDQRQKFNEDNGRIEECRREELSAQQEKNQAELDQRMTTIRTDPARMQQLTAKAMEWNPKIQAMLAANDSVGARTAMIGMQRDLARIVGYTWELDSAKATAKCGREAPKPTWLTAWDSTEVETKRLGDRVREAEMAGSAEAAAASGMTERQFAIARERVESFVNGGGMGFSRREKEALTPRRVEIRAYFPAG